MLVTKRLLVQVSLGTGHFVIFLSLPFPSPSLPSQRNFPISFKPKVAIAEFFWKMQKKSGNMKSGVDTMPLFLPDDLLMRTYFYIIMNALKPKHEIHVWTFYIPMYQCAMEVALHNP